MSSVTRVRAWHVGIAACLLALMLVGVAKANGSSGAVTVSVEMEAVAITITGAEVDFGGPHPSNTVLRAIRQTSSSDASPPTIENSGNVDIGFVEVTYTGPSESEAVCDGGDSSWAAGTSAGADRFAIEALVSTNENLSYVNDNSLTVDPAAGSGNVLDGTPISPTGSTNLQFLLWTPNPTTSGSNGCSIGISVTASASAD